MGVVVAAVHVHLGERVAIKFLHPEAMADTTTLARFFREGQAAAKIRSEHVARVYDVGTVETGAPYLVMEYLEGDDLATILKQRGPLPVAEAVVYVLQACEAIAEAHSLRIVHRDIKPANLFLTMRPDSSPVVKVIDFGISKVAEPFGPGLAVTKTAEVRGSPLFMPPEQLEATRDADARSDIWAIGVSLFNLLTGTHAFPAATLPALYSRVLHGEPVPLRALRPDAPVALEAAILRCLRKNPRERFASVEEFARAIGAYAPEQATITIRRIQGVLRSRASPGPGRAEPTNAFERAPGTRAAPSPSVTFNAAGELARASTGDAAGPKRREQAPSMTQPMVPQATPVSAAESVESPLLDSWETTRRRHPGRRRAFVIAACLTSALIGVCVSMIVVLRTGLKEPTALPGSDTTSYPTHAQEASPTVHPSSVPQMLPAADASRPPIFSGGVETAPTAAVTTSATGSPLLSAPAVPSGTPTGKPPSTQSSRPSPKPTAQPLPRLEPSPRETKAVF